MGWWVLCPEWLTLIILLRKLGVRLKETTYVVEKSI